MSLSWSSLPDVDSKNNVCLIYTHQQTIDVLKAGPKVCWRAWGFNFLRCKRLCLFALFSDIKKATRAKWNKELWWKWWLLRSFFNHIFQFPMLKLQQTKKLEWKCEKNIFQHSCIKAFYAHLTLFTNFSHCFSCSVQVPALEVQELHQLRSD